MANGSNFSYVLSYPCYGKQYLNLNTRIKIHLSPIVICFTSNLVERFLRNRLACAVILAPFAAHMSL